MRASSHSMASTAGRHAADMGAGGWGSSAGGGSGPGMGFAAGALGAGALGAAPAAGGDGMGTTKNPLVMTFVSHFTCRHVGI